MKINKFIASAMAVVFAAGVCAFAPIISDSGVSVSVSAEETDDGFVIKTDSYGTSYLAEYTGKGGEITIPAEAEYVGKDVFKKNTKVTKLTVPKTCKALFASSFERCINLKSVVFEGDMTLIDNKAFYSCPALQKVTFKGDVSSPYTNEESFQGGIWDYAFAYCSNLKTVQFSSKSKVDCIGTGAFMNCAKLETVKLPTKLEAIFSGAFESCPKLESVTIPAETELGKYVFGYMYDYAKGKYVRADGKKSAQILMRKYDFDKNAFIRYAEKYTQKAITLTVAAGSPAEKYAEKYKIKYTDGSGTVNSPAETEKSAEENSEETKTEKLAAPTGFTSSSEKTKISIRWEAVDGADKYRVYKYNPETDKYEKYKTVSNVNCTISDLEYDTEYKFKVVAVKTTENGDEAGKASKAYVASTK